jgi:hypothetical protein
MKKHVHRLVGALILVAIVTVSNHVRADECPTFTHEQNVLIRMAHAVGSYDDWGYTLAAIVWKESIVADHIIRVNGPDGGLGSYGVGHMQLTTAMWLLGITNRWEAKSTLAPRLINDDVFALELSLQYLVKHEDLGWRGMIAKYNGEGEAALIYSEDVVRRVVDLQRCMKM